MPLPRFPLVDWFAAAEGRFDISLSHSDCEPLLISDLMDEQELKRFADFRLGYGPLGGLEELRILVAQQYQTIEAEDVVIFDGASEAIYTFMRTMLNPGDEVIVQSPMFQSLHAIARSLGSKLIEWRCGFDEITYGHKAEIGYLLAKPYWGQGIMTDVVRAVCKFAMTNWKLVRITAHVFDFNEASARVLEKNGFEYEGFLRKHHRKAGQFVDSKVFAKVK